MTKTAIRKEERMIVWEIACRLIRYLTGPKFPGNCKIVKQITNAPNLQITICNGSDVPYMTLYFSYFISVRVYRAYGHALEQWELLGTRGGYSVYDADALPLCADYLKELCRLVSCYFPKWSYDPHRTLTGSPVDCSNGLYATWEDMVYHACSYETGKEQLEKYVSICRTRSYRRLLGES